MANLYPYGIDAATGEKKELTSSDTLVNNDGTPLSTSSLIFLERKDITTAATSTTFSGLDGDNDGIYYLTWYWINGNGSASQTQIYVRPNGLSTNQSGSYSSFSTTYSQGNTTDLRITNISLSTARSYGNATLWATTDGAGAVNTHRAFMSDISHMNGTAGGTRAICGASWNDTSTNITSLEIVGNMANTLGVGSVFVLYKMPI